MAVDKRIGELTNVIYWLVALTVAYRLLEVRASKQKVARARLASDIVRARPLVHAAGGMVHAAFRTNGWLREYVLICGLQRQRRLLRLWAHKGPLPVRSGRLSVIVVVAVAVVDKGPNRRQQRQR